jgi:hypothetical protein
MVDLDDRGRRLDGGPVLTRRVIGGGGVCAGQNQTSSALWALRV